MYSKQCFRCMKSSYSSSNLKNWQCPYCAIELKEVKAKVVNHSVNVTSINNRINQQRGITTYQQIH